MKYEIAVCDDNKTERKYLLSLINKWSGQSGTRVQVDVYSGAEEMLFAAKPWDIALLDIEMGGISGVELAHRLRDADKRMQIVFVTGYSDYIAYGYDVAALQYLMKPVSEEKFFATLDRAVHAIAKAERTLVFESEGVTVRLPLSEIQCLEVYGNYTTVFAEQSLEVRIPLRDIEKKLDERFFRIGRSSIVNLDYVRSARRNEVTLHGGKVLNLPRGAYDALNRAIIERK